MAAILFEKGACRASAVNANYAHWIQEDLNLPKSMILATREFCRDMPDPKNLLERFRWLKAETTCLTLLHIADPGGWMRAMRALSKEKPSEKKLRDTAYSLCESLRDGEMTTDEANYRFEQEMLRMKEHLPGETLEQALSDLGRIASFLAKFIPRGK